jgi:hypothetical protein
MKYTLKQPPKKDYVFEPPPTEFPHGSVEINATNWDADPDKDEIISAKAIGVYLVKFNTTPICYYVHEVVYGSWGRKTVAKVENLSSISDEFKAKVIDLIENA